MDRPGDLDHQAVHADHAAVDLDLVEFGDLFGERLHASSDLVSCAIRTIYGAVSLNSAFTRVVNDCLTVLGTHGGSPAQDGGASCGSWLTPILNVEREHGQSQENHL